MVGRGAGSRGPGEAAQRAGNEREEVLTRLRAAIARRDSANDRQTAASNGRLRGGGRGNNEIRKHVVCFGIIEAITDCLPIHISSYVQQPCIGLNCT